MSACCVWVGSISDADGIVVVVWRRLSEQRERLFELETALAAARNELTELTRARADATSRTSDSASDLERVVEVLAKKTLECDQLREVGQAGWLVALRACVWEWTGETLTLLLTGARD